jgi:hypothetical protein
MRGRLQKHGVSNSILNSTIRSLLRDEILSGSHADGFCLTPNGITLANMVLADPSTLLSFPEGNSWKENCSLLRTPSPNTCSSTDTTDSTEVTHYTDSPDTTQFRNSTDVTDTTPVRHVSDKKNHAESQLAILNSMSPEQDKALETFFREPTFEHYSALSSDRKKMASIRRLLE